VWDLCGGWRVDALLMAHWGFEVQSFEKSPWVHLLSSRALERSEILVHRDLKLEMHCQDALEALESRTLVGAPAPSIIYIDPMYPKTKSTALNQGEMRYLHYLSSEEDIAEDLLEKSLSVALERVIIKRPIKADEFARKASFQVEQGSTRYDVYVK
jgi:16S rRNA (guanine1516-N2)-methyltransferase